LLCDSPGLVFPTIASSKAEMICNGVLPIDNLKEFILPVQYVCDKIPKRVLAYILKIQLDSEENHIQASHLLFSYAVSRGYVSGSGQPDLTKASRLLLKDYNLGKILYCSLPNEMTEDEAKFKGIERYNYVPDDFVCENKAPEVSTNPVMNNQTNIKFQKYKTEDVMNEEA